MEGEEASKSETKGLSRLQAAIFFPSLIIPQASYFCPCELM